MSERGKNGRFAKGNPGGPGRPKRVVELDYLAALSEQVSIEAFTDIIKNTIERAKDGDAKARDYLSRYLLPTDKGNHLQQLAARESASDEGKREHSDVLTGNMTPAAEEQGSAVNDVNGSHLTRLASK